MLICRSNIVRLAVLLAALSLGGCAFTEDHIDVAYTPTPQEAVTKISTSQPMPVRVKVDDQRQSKDAVGHKQNGWGMDMASIVADKDISETIKSAIESELTNRGFALGPNNVLIEVVVSQFNNHFKAGFFSGTAVAEIVMNVTVKKPDGSIAYAKLVDAQGTEENIQLASGHNAKKALESALNNAMINLFSDSGFVNSIVQAASPKASTSNRTARRSHALASS